jgi:hypothetical protein
MYIPTNVPTYTYNTYVSIATLSISEVLGPRAQCFKHVTLNDSLQYTFVLIVYCAVHLYGVDLYAAVEYVVSLHSGVVWSRRCMCPLVVSLAVSLGVWFVWFAVQ